MTIRTGIYLYVLHRGETLEEFEQRDAADHFGLPNRTMSELESLAAKAGTGPVAGFVGEERVSAEKAAEMAKKIRAFLAESEPGPRGSTDDEEMRRIAADYAAFCERAAEQGGFAIT
jgi:hypothetical protein